MMSASLVGVIVGGLLGMGGGCALVWWLSQPGRWWDPYRDVSRAQRAELAALRWAGSLRDLEVK